MSVEVNTKNIQALMAHVEALVEKIAKHEQGLLINSNAILTVDNKMGKLEQLIHLALVKTKGTGSTEVDNGS